MKRITSGYRLSLVAGGDSLFLRDAREDGERVSRAVATADGSDRWTSSVSGDHVVPLLEAGLLAFYDSPDLIGVDAHTGETDWVTPETHPEIVGNTAPPELEPIAVSNDSLLVIESDGTDRSDSLRAVDPTTGSEQWVFDPEEAVDFRIHSAAVAGETVFLPVVDELILIDLASGAVLERHDCDDRVQSVTLAGGICLVATAEGIVAFEAA
ncbi:hypothetical protein CP557_19730 [Natrinema ejinorense]|uniref:Pyrrolo-quinoline quinone repeat domain-containing protein n=2 Tax=Natrinema ejinorense TaxID=373386 RepID=A0A2A5QQG6_9EURY|nr:hypothetical protein CP557_19730 [Natrinema ejinorense]